MANPLSKLSPESLRAIAGQGITEDKNSLLAAQLARLMGKKSEHVEHSSPIGAGLGGLAEAVDGVANNYHAAALRDAIGKNYDTQQDTMGQFAGLLGEDEPTPPGSPAAAASVPMGVPQQSPTAPPVQADPRFTPGPKKRGMLEAPQIPALSPFSY